MWRESLNVKGSSTHVVVLNSIFTLCYYLKSTSVRDRWQLPCVHPDVTHRMCNWILCKSVRHMKTLTRCHVAVLYSSSNVLWPQSCFFLYERTHFISSHFIKYHLVTLIVCTGVGLSLTALLFSYQLHSVSWMAAVGCWVHLISL